MASRIKYQDEYEMLYTTCMIDPLKITISETLAGKMINSRSRYEMVGKAINVPWYLIAVIHSMEASMNFRAHLHNGDPLSARTVHIPKGRPLHGVAPFSWEESAVDALCMKGFHKWGDWSLAGLLFCLEGYNGFGYRRKGIHSPYLWSFSNHYTKGKYKADGIYDPEAVSKQCGAAVLLKQLQLKEAIML